VPDAYLDALRLLARRELSEAQVRQRLTRKGHSADVIDAAIVRLREERALDDSRVADAIARAGISHRRYGKLRIRMEIQRTGISTDIARRAIDAAFDGIDDDDLIEQALRKRLRGRDTIADDREFARLHRYLLRQGFDPDRIVKLLSSRRSRTMR